MSFIVYKQKKQHEVKYHRVALYNILNKL